jgi:hypothetical protein
MVSDGNIEPFGGKAFQKVGEFLADFWCHALSCSHVTDKFKKHFSCLATCHIVGMVNFYRYHHNIYLSVPSPH